MIYGLLVIGILFIALPLVVLHVAEIGFRRLFGKSESDE